ncbi:hypothetical protein ES703_100529 [subsurface metagenome]
MEPNKCKFDFYLDEAGKPVIVAENPECQLIGIEALQSGDVTVKVKVAGVKAEPVAEPVTEPEPAHPET